MESGNIPAYLPTPMPPVCSICQPRTHRHGPGLLLPRYVIGELQGVWSGVVKKLSHGK
ncbi:uncharacterized protein B0T23DRAFT_369774 [Neurospora hispaniola]|uniref:Uncharacterized protein n=1 Tax=Neurospora hispaniola TaxID=588809 RepID=A0AAJ0MV54_9PEZI|nr:hypothetical protein B0T23DRAFT_369774 [Neurospora hispaniola]